MSDGPDRPAFTELVDLASARFGGEVVLANDEFFAPRDRLLLPEEPVFRKGAYTERGKWMDGWETRRRREPGHDWCLIRLGLPGVIRGVEVSTRHFRGNQPEACSLEACGVEPSSVEPSSVEPLFGEDGSADPGPPGTDAAVREEARAASDFDVLLRDLELPDREPAAHDSAAPGGGAPRPRSSSRAAPTWHEILPRSPLEGDARHFFELATGTGPAEPDDPERAPAGRERELRATHLLFRIYPDGGVARLRVHGEVRPDWEAILARLGPEEAVELAGIHRGGRVVAASDGTFADPRNLLLPGPARNMGEGWETRRRRGPGHELAIVALGRRARVSEIVVDTRHFRGNYPESCRLEACDAPGARLDQLTAGDPSAGDPSAEDPSGTESGSPWLALLPRSPLGPDAVHVFRDELDAVGPITHVRFHIYPDGGVSRLRLRGRPVDPEARR